MDFNRRDLFKGFFSGVVVSAFGAEKLVEVYHEHDHYTAPGKFNVWYVHDNKWYLFSDSHRAPFEFRSADDAHSFVKEMNLETYSDWNDRKLFNKVDDPNGLVAVRKAPQVIHDFSYLRLSEDQSNTFIRQSGGAFNPTTCNLFRQLLMAEDGGDQAKIWIRALNTPTVKRDVLKYLRNNEMFRTFIHSVYFGSDGPSYHVVQAILETFYHTENYFFA